MPKSWRRLVPILLIPCLLADSASAVLARNPAIAPMGLHASYFAQQAMASAALPFLHSLGILGATVKRQAGLLATGATIAGTRVMRDSSLPWLTGSALVLYGLVDIGRPTLLDLGKRSAMMPFVATSLAIIGTVLAFWIGQRARLSGTRTAVDRRRAGAVAVSGDKNPPNDPQTIGEAIELVRSRLGMKVTRDPEPGPYEENDYEYIPNIPPDQTDFAKAIALLIWELERSSIYSRREGFNEVKKVLQRVHARAQSAPGSPATLWGIVMTNSPTDWFRAEDIRRVSYGGHAAKRGRNEKRMLWGIPLALDTVQRDLGVLVKLGLLEREGRGKRAVYRSVFALEVPPEQTVKLIADTLKDLGPRPSGLASTKARMKLAPHLPSRQRHFLFEESGFALRLTILGGALVVALGLFRIFTGHNPAAQSVLILAIGVVGAYALLIPWLRKGWPRSHERPKNPLPIEKIQDPPIESEVDYATIELTFSENERKPTRDLRSAVRLSLSVSYVAQWVEYRVRLARASWAELEEEFQSIAQEDPSVFQFDGGPVLPLKRFLLDGHRVQMCRWMLTGQLRFSMTVIKDHSSVQRAGTLLAEVSDRLSASFKGPWPQDSLRILVVDDEESARHSRIMEVSTAADRVGRSILVEQAEDGAPAIAMVQEAMALGRPFDLVITDASMGRVNGIAMAKAIRVWETKAQVPPMPIVMIARGNHLADPAIAEGVSHFAEKGTEFARIHHLLSQALNERIETLTKAQVQIAVKERRQLIFASPDFAASDLPAESLRGAPLLNEAIPTAKAILEVLRTLPPSAEIQASALWFEELLRNCFVRGQAHGPRPDDPIPLSVFGVADTAGYLFVGAVMGQNFIPEWRWEKLRRLHQRAYEKGSISFDYLFDAVARKLDFTLEGNGSAFARMGVLGAPSAVKVFLTLTLLPTRAMITEAWVRWPPSANTKKLKEAA